MELNKEQKRAVVFEGRSLIVKAGPGTGKTRVLVERVAYLASKGVKPELILVLTFTRKAVKEIKERLKKKKVKGVEVKTFHGWSYELLKTEDDSLKLIEERKRKKLIRKLGIKKYKEKLKELELLDFDDLVIMARDLLKKKQNRKRYEYVLVDEFQDTNEEQYELLKLIVGGANICVIGDPRQSIYAFRGATPTIFKKFKEDFGKAKEIGLKINYRSRAGILKAAQKLFKEDDPAKSYAFRRAGGDGEVKLVRTLDEYTEADWILRLIEKKIGGLGLVEASELRGQGDKEIKWKDVAVIYRTHRLNRVLKEKFGRLGIPFQVIGVESDWEQGKMRELVAGLRFLGGEGQWEEELEDLGMNEGEIEWLKELGELKIGKIVDKLIKRWGIEMDDVLREFRHILIGLKDLRKFGEYHDSLIENDYYDEQVDKVTLMTMHATKGLEFKYVVVAGFEEWLSKDEDEERRLLYVAMTRAKEGLFLLTTEKRGGKKQKVSRFLKEIRGGWLVEEEDERMEKERKRRARRRLKKAQIKLF
jgi:superfamily I DNA/RNA helicase